MRPEQPTPQVAIVVKWPNTGANGPAARQLAGKLAERRLAATWAIAAPEQVESVSRWSSSPVRFEAALLAPARDVVASLKSFATTSESLATVCLGTEPVRDQDFRTLCQLGVRTIVAEAAHSVPSGVQPLPFGLLQFTPALCTPTAGWLERWFGKMALNLPADIQSGKTLVAIDLLRLATVGGRGWRELDRVLHQLDEARRQGQIVSATITEVAAELGRKSAARPQRSILRAA
jgi:hypothetical protein